MIVKIISNSLLVIICDGNKTIVFAIGKVYSYILSSNSISVIISLLFRSCVRFRSVVNKIFGVVVECEIIEVGLDEFEERKSKKFVKLEIDILRRESRREFEGLVIEREEEIEVEKEEKAMILQRIICCVLFIFISIQSFK